MADCRIVPLAVSAVLLASLASCGGGGGGGGGSAGTPTPTPTTASLSVTPCLNQTVPGTGTTVAGLVVPDTITVNLSQPSGFPNGRRLQDSVVDVTLAALFLDLDVHSPLAFANIPLNPPANDRPFRAQFPYLAPPQGNPPLSGSDTATGFVFVNQPASAFVRVDREGMPALATALIGGPLKNRFNDADPADDATGEFVPEMQAQLKLLAEALSDDISAAGFTTCAIPI